MRKTWNIFYPESLDIHFKNIRRGTSCFHEYIYVLSSEKGDIAQIGFHNRKLTVYIDNFPGTKLYYESNFPIKSRKSFVRELKRVGLTILEK